MRGDKQSKDVQVLFSIYDENEFRLWLDFAISLTPPPPTSE